MHNQARAEPIRIVLADDHAIVHSALRVLLEAESGFEIVAEVEASPGTSVVVLTMKSEPRFAREAFRGGALGFVLEAAADTELVAAVRAAVAGLSYLNPQLGALIASAPETPPASPDNLSEREVEVLRLVALGHTNAEISRHLYLSVRTVESHRAHMQEKSGRRTRAELVAYVREHGLLEPASKP